MTVYDEGRVSLSFHTSASVASLREQVNETTYRLCHVVYNNSGCRIPIVHGCETVGAKIRSASAVVMEAVCDDTSSHLWNLSCPAVSHISNLITLSSKRHFWVRNAAPTVVRVDDRYQA